MVGRIAPYQANNIQRSYLRQQRVGERIADAKAKAAADQPSVEVEISPAARQAAEAAATAAAQQKSQRVETLSERFVNQFLPPAQDEENGPEDEKRESGKSTEGRAAFVRLIESFGMAVRQSDDGEDQAVVNKETGEVLVSLNPESRDTARNEIRNLVQNILTQVL